MAEKPHILKYQFLSFVGWRFFYQIDNKRRVYGWKNSYPEIPFFFICGWFPNIDISRHCETNNTLSAYTDQMRETYKSSLSFVCFVVMGHGATLNLYIKFINSLREICHRGQNHEKIIAQK